MTTSGDVLDGAQGANGIHKTKDMCMMERERELFFEVAVHQYEDPSLTKHIITVS